MKVAFIHVSDLHLRVDRDNPVLQRTDQLVQAIKSLLTPGIRCIFLVSGDIAFSGKEAEYELASKFIDTIGLSLLENIKLASWEEVYVPGNHDCDFSQKPFSHELLLDSIISEFQTNVILNPGKVEEALTVQDKFFNFVASRTSKTFASVDDRLAWQRLLVVEKETIAIRCFNTAWLSRLHEQKGMILAPTWLVPLDYQSSLNIAVFHHPTAWMETVNAGQFADAVEKTTDLIFTGHEHKTSEYTKLRVTGENSRFFEANALQDEKNNDLSGFHVYLVDLQDRQYKTVEFDWNGHIYSRSTDTDWTPFERSRSVVEDNLENNKDYAATLSNPGAHFTHPHADKVLLKDIFVYPDLAEWDVARGKVKKTVTGRVKGKSLAGYTRDNQKVIIFGRERIGKTALAKTMYRDFQEQDVIPVMLSGEQLKSPEEAAIIRVIERQFIQQYNDGALEKYRQLPTERRVVIVDDFDECKLNKAGWNRVIECLTNLVGAVVLLASDSFQLEQLRDLAVESSLLSFKHCWIKEFGQMHRFELINKWLILGREYTITESEKSQKLKELEPLMRVILGRNLLPSYPLFVLTVLQSYEASITSDTATGAFSYHYEVLIKAQLGSVKTTLTPDTLTTYLSILAFEMFKEKKKCMEQSQIETITSDYHSLHSMKFETSVLMQSLLDASVFEKMSDGRYRFAYSYLYYYFVARFFATNIHTKKHENNLRLAISYLIEHLHVEDYANIVIFLVYLTSDERLIELIVAKGKAQYAGYTPCDYNKDFQFLDHLLVVKYPEIVLNNPDDPNAKLEFLRGVDEARELDEDEQNSDFDDRIEESDLDEYLHINVALKVMQILGQIVRNVPGTLVGEKKLEMVKEAYMIGLRLSGYLTSILAENIDDMRIHYARRIHKELRIDNPADLMIKTDNVITDLMLLSAYGIIQRVSNSVGSVHLEETYKQIKSTRLEVPIDLVNIAIRMDHFRTFPKNEAVKLYNNLDTRYIAQTVLRWLVRDHFYKYPEDISLRQSVCAQLNIKVNEIGFVGRVDKKLLPVSGS